jgi:hypothetical protein
MASLVRRLVKKCVKRWVGTATRRPVYLRIHPDVVAWLDREAKRQRRSRAYVIGRRKASLNPEPIRQKRRGKVNGRGVKDLCPLRIKNGYASNANIFKSRREWPQIDDTPTSDNVSYVRLRVWFFWTNLYSRLTRSETAIDHTLPCPGDQEARVGAGCMVPKLAIWVEMPSCRCLLNDSIPGRPHSATDWLERFRNHHGGK